MAAAKRDSERLGRLKCGPAAALGCLEGGTVYCTSRVLYVRGAMMKTA